MSNSVLDELDRELERRGLRFVRYADDFSVFVQSERTGRRVMDSVHRFIEHRLRLVVNEDKPRLEPRKNLPRGSPCARPQTLVAGQPGDAFQLVFEFHDGERHLPVVSLKRVAA